MDTIKSWQPGGRDTAIAELVHDSLNLTGNQAKWDLVIVGGGITGAGIFREATRRNLKVLLIEQKDFAWGTSSKSSKMVHGGLRYLGSGQFGLTLDSVRERQRLMTEAPGLVDPLNFLMGHYHRKFPGPRLFNLLLTIYDWMAGKRNHRFYTNRLAGMLAPGMNNERLNGATKFADAVTDDARLVLRVLHEGLHEGGLALNYIAAKEILRDDTGQVSGVRMQDRQSGKVFEVKCAAVINATGAWTDELRQAEGESRYIRPLRGSHLIFPMWRLPVSFSVSFFHPKDGRPVFVFPWEGVAVAGTTDLDHKIKSSDDEVAITQQEVDYLLEGVNAQFPAAALTEQDAIGSYAGIRPVVSSGALNPSSEKREHSIWNDKGLISVAGGKLTTFRLIALDVLNELEGMSQGKSRESKDCEIFKQKFDFIEAEKQAAKLPGLNLLERSAIQRLSGRYGADTSKLLCSSSVQNYQAVHTTDTRWAEIDYALAHEQVVCLEDLMLRRTRLGLLLPNGAKSILPMIRTRCQGILGWTDKQWESQVEEYLDVWRKFYALPAERDRLGDHKEPERVPQEPVSSPVAKRA